MNSYFIKTCRTNRAFVNELFVYQSSFPNKAELIEIKQRNTLVLKRLDGISYLDEANLTEDIVTKLAKAISKLHSLQYLEDKVLCHWDNQPQNILWDEGKKKIWLVDFEDIRLAHPEADIAHLFLFWAENMDKETFTRLTNVFLTGYKGPVTLNIIRWEREIRNAKQRLYRRRKKYRKKVDSNHIML